MERSLYLNQLVHFPTDIDDKIYNKTFVGIDFGTSTTVVSIASYDRGSNLIMCTTLELPQKEIDGNIVESELLPSVIAVGRDGAPLVGMGAFSLKTNPDYELGTNIWYSFKMELGKDLGPMWYGSEIENIKSPQDATRFFFKYLKRCIEKVCADNNYSPDIHYAVSIPASFESNQRRDLLDALSANGIVLSGSNLIDEPNAAFIGYVNPDIYNKEPIELSEGYNPKVLVFDFGAGTCDISILEISADYKGYHTKNLSISQFSELGGNNIDDYIARTYLLPKILELNNVDKDEYTSKQIDCIVKQLLGVAELLKIKICKDFIFLLEDREFLDDALAHNKCTVINKSIEIYTDYVTLQQDKFSLSYKSFIDTMNVFFSKDVFSPSRSDRMRRKYNSIYATLDSAISKAHIDIDEIDYVMMIGGSSKNPFVQHKIREYFKKVDNRKILVPQDMQSLVSQGAAIHSLLINGLSTTIVKPITSEPIVVITAGERPVSIIPAGTEIPFPSVSVDRFSSANREMQVVEIPICVTNEKKMLVNLKITDQYGLPIEPNTSISVVLNMNADKVLVAKAICNGEEYKVECENPFSNTYMTDEDNAIMDAQRQSYIAADKNGGVPTRQSLEHLRKTYEDAEKNYDAAEVLEEQLQYYPQSNMYNYLGVLYHNGGNYTKAIKYYKKAIKEDPSNSWPYSNLGHDYYIIGKYEEAKVMLDKAIELRAESTSAMIVYGKILNEEGNKDEAIKYYNQAYNILMRYYHSHELCYTDYGWLIDVAERLGKYDIANEVEADRPKKSGNRRYNRENLVELLSKEK